jgi:hypothetical protein
MKAAIAAGQNERESLAATTKVRPTPAAMNPMVRIASPNR